MTSELREGVSIVGIGTMGAAYVTRLSSLGIPLTLYNRTKAKATQVASGKPNVAVADSLEEAVKARPIVLVACSPKLEAVRALFDSLVERHLVQGKHLVFILDAGLKVARYLDEVLAKKGGAASVTSAFMFGSCYDAMKGTGGVLNASGTSAPTPAVKSLLEQLGAVTFHEGGPRAAAMFSMAAHAGFVPMLYAHMHYQAMMAKAGIDPQAAAAFFKLTNQVVLDGYVPMLQGVYEKRDYSLFFFSHKLVAEILEEVAETSAELGVDPRMAQLMAAYPTEAAKDPALAGQCFTSVYELIAPKSR